MVKAVTAQFRFKGNGGGGKIEVDYYLDGGNDREFAVIFNEFQMFTEKYLLKRCVDHLKLVFHHVLILVEKFHS